METETEVVYTANRKRKHYVRFMVTDRELALIKRKVRLSGLNQREFLMRCVTGKEIIVKEGGLEILHELKKQGNNLNQIAYMVNAGQIGDCSTELAEIYAALREVRKEWQ
ncbi:MAG: plasmid mobilization protein [Christensenellaceae bacterium]